MVRPPQLPMIDRDHAIAEIQARLSDVLNYDTEDPMTPIDPISYRTPEGDSCLHLACVRGDIKAAEILIGLGLDVNSAGDLGNTPLHYAKTYGYSELADLLVRHGADATCVNELGTAP